MSAPVWTELVCRCCARTVAGQFVTGPIRRRAMANEATMHGWVLDTKICDWFCSRCKGLPERDELREEAERTKP